MRITSCALEGRVQLAASPGAQSACRPEQRSPRAASTHAGWASSERIHAVGMQADFQVTQTHPCAAADKVLPVQRPDGMPCAAHLAVEAARAVWQADVHLQGRGIPARRHSAKCSTGQTSRRCRLSMEWQQLPRMQGHCSVGDCIQQQAT